MAVSGSQALASFNLTDMQMIFIRKMSLGSNPADSAKLAGYSNSETQGYALLRLPQVREALRSEITRVLETVSAPLALKVLNSIVTDETAGPRIRVDAAKILLDRAGYAPPTRSTDDQATKQLADMSSDELRGFIDKHESEIQKVEGELAARATPVNAPISEAMPDKGNDYLD